MSKHITMQDWERADSFYKAAEPGDTVDEAIVNEFRDILPPASMHWGYLQVGEPASHVEDENGTWRATYPTFHVQNGAWVYCGECFLNETVDRSDIPLAGSKSCT